MGLLEARVHDLLKAWQQQQPVSPWSHALTMGRLVSRALRLRRSALIQTGCLPTAYGVSYLIPCLLSDHPIRLVTTARRRDQIIHETLPALQNWLLNALGSEETVLTWPKILTPEQWLQAGTSEQDSQGVNPTLTAIEQAEYLEDWTRQFLSHQLEWSSLHPHLPQDPQHQDHVLTHWSRLSQSLFSRPSNPHGCYLLGTEEIQALQEALRSPRSSDDRINGVEKFWQFWQSHPDNHLLWATVDRGQGRIRLHLSPVDVKPWLAPLWQGNPCSPTAPTFLLMGSFLDADKTAPTFRKTLGLPDLLCLKFIPHRAQDALPIYLPDRLPLPNTPAFQPTLLAEIKRLLQQLLTLSPPPFVVILLDDLPLKAQLGSQLAAEFGSAVKVEPLARPENPPRILVGGWRYWHEQQTAFPAPQVLILGTLPIPSLEHPLVASRVQYHKRHHQDWFRGYLLPSALKDLQQAVLPLREAGGWLAVLDDRVNSRSYGREVLNALAPYAKSSYFDVSDWQIIPLQ
jgi:ATP-dependent DNA helicase DinG